MNKDTPARAHRYVYYIAKNQLHFAQQVIPRHYPTAEFPSIHHMQTILKEARAYKNPHEWSDKRLREMAAESSGDPKDDELAIFAYEVVYKLTSHHCHATMVALQGEHFDRFGIPYRIRPAKEKTHTLGRDALFNVQLYLVCILKLMFKAMGDEASHSALVLRLAQAMHRLVEAGRTFPD
jgi:hypothetical protein